VSEGQNFVAFRCQDIRSTHFSTTCSISNPLPILDNIEYINISSRTPSPQDASPNTLHASSSHHSSFRVRPWASSALVRPRRRLGDASYGWYSIFLLNSITARSLTTTELPQKNITSRTSTPPPSSHSTTTITAACGPREIFGVHTV